jgi:capsular exopolysaccharide synthesis family protein
MRRPNCHKELNLRNVKGLSNYLAQDDNIALNLQVAVRPGIDTLTAGPLPPNPTELLNSNKMRDTIGQLRDYYDYIILDTPPIIGFSDTIILSQYADGIVIVVESSKTSRQQLKLAKQSLQQAKAKILGVVLNKINRRDLSYHQYHYQNYGDYYGQDENNRPQQTKDSAP